jgi:cell wall-associated NlpC family hydrolase
LKNRKSSSPILCAVVLSLALVPGRLSVAEPDDTDAMASAQASAAPTVPILTYTVVRGDTLASIAHKFGLTLTQLKRLNNLPPTKVGVKRGQVLQVVYVNGAVPATTTAATVEPKKKTHVPAPVAAASVPSSYALAQPVQDFDMAEGGSSTTATAPTAGTTSVKTVAKARHAPVAKLVSPQELSADETRAQQQQQATLPILPPPAPDAVTTQTITVLRGHSSSSKHPQQETIVGETTSTTPVATAPLPAPRVTSPAPGLLAKLNPFYTPPASDWGSRFLTQARQLGDEGIGYDDEWRPPGESHAWAMDCSNTARYIYRVTAGIELPRTASDQYYYLHLQGKAWDVPQNSYGWADTDFLRRNLKPGDLLFWENTYKPERQPPITHVMIFLGTNAQGQWIMAGSQSSRGGEHNRRSGGPDIYIFRPAQPCGGYTTWLGMVHHTGRFCAFGRPLEADRSKLSMAED